MITASSLARNCRHDKDVLDKVPPRTAQERQREANKRASADRGTAGHLLFEAWATTGQVSHSDDLELQGMLDALAAQWRPPPTYQAEVMWGLSHEGNYVEVCEPEPHKYQSTDGSQLLTAGRADGIWTSEVALGTPRNVEGIFGAPPRVHQVGGGGSADVLEPKTTALFVVDFKFGKWPVDPARINLQVNAAGMALALRGFSRLYVPAIYYSRDAVFDWGDPVTVGSKEWKAMFEEVRTAALLDAEPHVGEHCGACWSKGKCGAYATVSQQMDDGNRLRGRP